MKKIILSILALIMMLIIFAPARTTAFNQADFDKAKGGNSCDRCDLSGACLVNLNFSTHSMINTNLKGAALMNAKFINAKLDYADFSGAALMNADFTNCMGGSMKFRGANLIGANLTRCTIQADWTDAVLTGATWIDGRKCGAGSIGMCR